MGSGRRCHNRQTSRLQGCVPDGPRFLSPPARAADRGAAVGAPRRHDPRSRRQVDFAPSVDVGCARCWPDRDHRPARRRGRARDGGGAECARRPCRACRRRQMGGRRGRRRRARRARKSARPRQFRDVGAAFARHPVDPSVDRLCHRRRVAAAPPDGPRDRAVEPFRRPFFDPRGCPPAARGDRGEKPDPDRIPAAGAVGPGQIGGAARWPQHAGLDDRRRAAGDA